MKSINKLSIFLVALLIATNASFASVVAKDVNIIIERSPSLGKRISQVIIKPIDSKIRIYGEIHKQHRCRRVIKGHIDITVLSPNGDVLKQLKTNLQRPSLNSSKSLFRIDIPLELSENSTIRVVHHRGNAEFHE